MGYHNTRANMPLGVWHYLMKGVVETPSRERDAAIRSGELNDGPGDKDLPFASDLRNNVASARDLVDIMEKIHAGEMISAEASAQMIDMMNVPKSPNRIRQYLKPDIETARKTGGSGRIKADTGIVYLPTGPMFVPYHLRPTGGLRPGDGGRRPDYANGVRDSLPGERAGRGVGGY